MPSLDHPLLYNKLLALLPAADFDRIVNDLTHVELPRGSILAAAGERIEHVYFLTSGIASVVITTSAGRRAEAGLFGWDGYLPTSAAIGFELSPHDVNIQVAGDGARMHFDAFRRWMVQSRSFSTIIMRSLECFAVQLAYTAVSNAVHGVNERLARWLLMCHDRVPTNEIALTHDFIAVMLAVHRPSVTTSLHVLEGNGFITAERGLVTIRNRSALEEFARDAYGKPEQEYRRLMMSSPLAPTIASLNP